MKPRTSVPGTKIQSHSNLSKYNLAPRARGYKTFFMLNSAEHENLNAHKYENIKELSIFSGPVKPRRLFFLIINENANSSWHFNIYEKETFHAQLS